MLYFSKISRKIGGDIATKEPSLEATKRFVHNLFG